MTHAASAAQLAWFDRTPADRGVVLFYQFTPGTRGASALEQLAVARGAELAWAAGQEQALIGPIGDFANASMLRFRTRAAARAFVTSAEHAAAVQDFRALLVSVLTPSPRVFAWIASLLAIVAPRWPFDNTQETSEEPGIDTSSVMPRRAPYAEFHAHAQQDTPVVMVNFIKFRARAAYADGDRGLSGRAAYLRYGKVAVLTAHSLGSKLLAVGRYLQILVGRDGDPSPDLWDEFALMQYAGRASFLKMASLRRYRPALEHRTAGLAENGQGLAVTRPRPEFVWRR
jgi:hypothetical protein